MLNPTNIRLDDVVTMRKTHPCGGTTWQVVRLGTDIGIKCLTCGHKVYLERSRFARQVKTFVSRGPETPPLVQG